MQVAVVIPSQKDLLVAYNKLQANPATVVSTEKLMEWILWSRFDPRLGEIVVHYLKTAWQKHNPLELNVLAQQGPWPAVLPVILAQTEIAIDTNSEKKLFRHFQALTNFDIKPTSYQSYFIGIHATGGEKLFQTANRPHPIYKRWGFYEVDLMVQLKGKSKTTWKKKARENLIADLFKKQKTITVADLVSACGGALHRRQAERDLAECRWIKKIGNTRNRHYVKR
jgi:hypothetical protein